MSHLRRALSLTIPSLIIGSLLFFVYYSLVIYQPTGHVACQTSVIAQQTDVAIHVVREWLGHESNVYAACPMLPGK